MPYREQPMSAAWLPPGPVPRRVPDGAILVRRMNLTPNGPLSLGAGELARREADVCRRRPLPRLMGAVGDRGRGVRPPCGRCRTKARRRPPHAAEQARRGSPGAAEDPCLPGHGARLGSSETWQAG